MLGQFATQETLYGTGELTAGMIQSDTGRGQRFVDFLAAHPGKGADFLKKSGFLTIIILECQKTPG